MADPTAVNDQITDAVEEQSVPESSGAADASGAAIDANRHRVHKDNPQQVPVGTPRKD
jgi:hypothetical protein